MQTPATPSSFQSIAKKLLVATASLAALLLSITGCADNSSQNNLNNLKQTSNSKVTGSTKPKIAKRSTNIPVPKLSTKAYVLMDANSGKIIAEKHMNVRRAPASLAKLMTLFVISNKLADGQLSLEEKIHISKKASRQGGSSMHLKKGDTVTVKDLIRGMIIASGNDACLSLAEHIAGNKKTFAEMMNNAASTLGMKNSHFVTSTGLPSPNQYSTAYDLAILSRALIYDFPADYKWYKEKSITYNGFKQSNRNCLIFRDSSVDGLKTGYTRKAGYCLIASAKRKQSRLISVIMGTQNKTARIRDSERLLKWGYRYFENH